MYLKGIEVCGFKSFARKTEFHFQDGITGIVGPNGSGKSNVADAMRWVLGEQSAKQLRSSNMQDVIFAGTQNRRAQGYAYVNIVFDNSDHRLPIDYDEVTIGRRVYRSGESEYLINSNTCRLKDIQELFYDTGIGKEGYSIIGQGQIDKILSGKPEDRRELFDEAAGIVKFKKRKNEALSRLAKEEESLVRIQDILAELTRQEGPLKNQAAKAKEYLRLHDELRICDVNDYLMESEDGHKQMKILDQKLEISQKQLEEAKQKAEQVKERYNQLGDTFSRLNQELDQLRKDQEEAKDGLRGRQAGIAVLKEQILAEKEKKSLYEEQKTSLWKQIEEEEGEYHGLLSAYETLQKQKEQEDASFSELEGRIADCMQKLSRTEEAYRSQQEQEQELTKKQSLLLVDRQKYDTMSEQTQLRTAELNGKLLQARGQEAEAKAQLHQGKTAMKQIGEEIADCKQQIQSQESRIAGQEASLTKLRKEADEAHMALHQATARFDSVQNLAERYEGYGMSVRRLMEKRSRFPGIHGVLADLIHVEKRYETAIETALGASLQNIVTDHEQTAKQCIEYLKQNRMGRATFLPLTTVKSHGGFRESSALDMPGVCQTADQLVHTGEIYRGIIRFLLGRILVVDTMDHALAVAARYHYSFRIVTLEGESLNAGGSISGGAYRNSSNLLGRKRELEELEQRIAQAKAHCEKADTAVELGKANQEKAQEKLALLQETMQEKQLEFSRIELTLRQNRDLLDAARDEMHQLEQDVAELLQKKQQLSADYEQTRQTAKELEEQTDRARILSEKLKKEGEDLQTDLDKLREQKVSGQISLTALQEKRTHMQADLERRKTSISQKREQLSRYQEELENSRTLVEEKERQILEADAQILKAGDQVAKLEEQIAQTTARREQTMQKQQKLFGEQEQAAQESADLEKECYRLENQHQQLDDGLERKASYLWEEYELTPSQAESYRREDNPARGELKRQIQQLKGEIRALGSINTSAVEEYEELSGRLTFMRTQHEDLVHARENLQILIEQLNEGMLQQFTEKFKQIQQEFDTVFKELFGGGYGTLELAQADNMLEAGILIHVQPPGKKLQNMMQLSGGEKALTAISLLFAIQNLKPSPFCILDEIEAALDDANVDRFAAYLNKLKKNTQFIVITHRRGTMLIADQLYGITMQEKGISSLVSVDLTDAEEYDDSKKAER